MPTPDRTSVAEIVAAGRELLEVAGPSGLTMQAVAERVGVRAPSLYKRVRDRDGLLALVATATSDELADRLAATDGTIEGLAWAFRSFATERPEGFRLLATSRADADSLARVTAPILRVAEQRVGAADALDAARLVVAWLTGFLTMELAGAFRLRGDLDRAFRFGLDRLAVALTPRD